MPPMPMDCEYPLWEKQQDVEKAAQRIWVKVFTVSAHGGSNSATCLDNADVARENYLKTYYPTKHQHSLHHAP